MSQRRPPYLRFHGQGCRAIARRSPISGWALVSVVLIAVVLSGCATSTSPPPASPENQALDQLRERAVTALETRRAAQAKQLYGSILASAPDDPEALMGLGEAEVLLREYGPALDHSRKAAELAGERTDLKARARHNAGVALLFTDRPQEARRELEAAVDLDPTSWRAWNALGRARDARGAWEEARAAYERALALAPEEGAVLNNYGMSKLSAGDPEGAADLFVRALEASPDLAPAETNLRLALALDGQYEQALAGVSAEKMPDALNNAGYAALLRGDYAQARILLLRAIDASPGFYEPAWSNLRFLSSVEQRQAPALEAP
ncbi:MAG TPA: tetratricopeptide repeat protein [Geminicoccaceae bacterium]|nr:tetratricopeptide repeat protein [Geminicoccaceae bacterium]